MTEQENKVVNHAFLTFHTLWPSPSHSAGPSIPTLTACTSDVYNIEKLAPIAFIRSWGLCQSPPPVLSCSLVASARRRGRSPKVGLFNFLAQYPQFSPGG